LGQGLGERTCGWEPGWGRLNEDAGGGRGNTVLVLFFSFISTVSKSGPVPRCARATRSLHGSSLERALGRARTLVCLFLASYMLVGSFAVRACVSRPRGPADELKPPRYLRTVYFYPLLTQPPLSHSPSPPQRPCPLCRRRPWRRAWRRCRWRQSAGTSERARRPPRSTRRAASRVAAARSSRTCTR